MNEEDFDMEDEEEGQNSEDVEMKRVKNVAVVPGARGDAGVNAPMCVAEGDGVPLPEFGGSKIEMDGEEFEMTRETDIVSSTEHINSVGKKKVQSNIDKLLVKAKEAERKQWKCIKIK